MTYTEVNAILTEREEKIRAFKSRPYFEVFGDFGVEAGEYRGRWFREDFTKNGDEDARAERIWEAAEADAIKERCLGKTGIATEERKPTTQAPPLLYDLTSLQRDANGRGFSAKRRCWRRSIIRTSPRSTASTSHWSGSAASTRLTGTSTRKSSPRRLKTGCSATRVTTYRSPGGPPFFPALPLPGTRIFIPSFAPAGILTVTCRALRTLATAWVSASHLYQRL
jgi:hypothetical protein